MKIGFTGTREGMTQIQKDGLSKELDKWSELKEVNGIEEFHHGDCIGADKEANDLVAERNVRIYLHPPSSNSQRAYCKHYVSYNPLPYLQRNKQIVDMCDLLLACPKGQEELRSGTWSTIRYAKSIQKPIRIIYPDGTIEKIAGRLV